MFERVQGSTRAASQNLIKMGPNSKIRESSFLYPSAKLWNMAPISVVEATNELNARRAIRDFAKKLPQ